MAEVSFGRLTLLDPASTTFEEMLTSYHKSMLSRGYTQTYARASTAIIQRFQRFTDDYPWKWKPGDVEDFTAHLMSMNPPLAHSTVRGYHQSLRAFCSYLTDAAYDWHDICVARFGDFPTQIFNRWNTTHHLNEFEGRASRRALSYDETEKLFATADDRAETLVKTGAKGALPALRDAQLLKTIYAFGLRRTEARMLDIHDLRPNHLAPRWGEYGVVHVRNGKAKRGGAPRRRSVLALPEFDWAIHGLRYWVENVRPRFSIGDNVPALWVSERRARMGLRSIDDRFAMIRDAAGLDSELTLHSLRHSYVTHLIEHGYAERFVQEQVGHEYSSSTAIYTSVSDDFKNRHFAQAMARAFPQLEGA